MTVHEPILNPATLNLYLGGASENSAPSEEDFSVLCHCLEIVRSNVAKRFETLDLALQSQNFDLLAHTAHQLKGSFLTAGATTLAEISESIYTNARMHRPENLSQLIERLKKFGPDFFEELEGVIQGLKMHS